MTDFESEPGGGTFEEAQRRSDALRADFASNPGKYRVLTGDGTQKMSKSRDNAVMLRASADETAQLVKKAKTDSNRDISYDPAAARQRFARDWARHGAQ